MDKRGRSYINRSTFLKPFSTFLLLFTLSIKLIAGDVIYVKSDAAGAENGTSWNDAYTDLQSALDNATSEDEIWVAEGTYKPTKDMSGDDSPVDARTVTFLLVTGVDLYGGFDGTEVTLHDRDWEVNETILSGDLGTVDDESDNSYYVVKGITNCELNGFIIEGGNGNGTSPNNMGGGIQIGDPGNTNPTVRLSDMKVENCIIRNNYSDQGGGVATLYCGDLMIFTNCQFLENSSEHAGGMGNWDTKAFIDHCLFTGNSANDPSSDYGSAIYNWGGGANSEIISCTFYDNSTNGSGGTIHTRGTGVLVTITNCILWGNGSDDLVTSEGTSTLTYSIIQQSGFAGSNHNIDDDPLLTDPDNGDFNLSLVSSPAVDAGDPNSDYDPDSTQADMGAYPFFQINGTTNTGIAELVTPESATSAGINRFVVTFTNFGSGDISSVQIGLMIDDSIYTDYTWIGDLLSGQTSNEIHLGTFSIPSGNPDVKIWTEAPNSSTDDYALNDTLTTGIQFNTTPMTGEYIVGSLPADFEEINHAAQHLMENGVSGSVIVNIKPGTYDEQVSLGNITGADAGNTITFQSQDEDSTTVILTYSPTSADDNFTLRFDSASYTTFQHMTIQSQGAGDFARVIDFKTRSNNISFISNRIIGIEASVAGAELLYSGGGETSSPTPVINDILTIENNVFQNGRHGIYYKGWGTFSGDDITVKDNQFFDQLVYGMFFQRIDNLEISGNEIDLQRNGANFVVGVYLVGCQNNINILKNIISITGYRGYGIRFEIERELGTGGLIANNFIHIETNSGNTSSGFFFTNISSPYKIYHNSINMTGSATASRGIYFSESDNFLVKNNNISNVAGGYPILFFNCTGYALDYNNYYNSGDYIGQFESTDISDLDIWKDSTSQDANSVSIHPHFKSDSDLHTTFGLLDNLGTPLGEVTDDIDGEARDGTNPDMGADEFTSPDNDMAVVEFLGPADDCGLTDSESLSLKVTNVGAVSQSNIPLKFSVDEGVTISDAETLAGPVDPGDTAIFTFTANLADLSVPGIYEGAIALSDAGDTNQENDTLWIKITHYPEINTFPFAEDFEAGDETFSLRYEAEAYAETEIVDSAANSSSFGLRLGSWTSNGWSTYSAPGVWTENTGQLASAYTCSIDGTTLTNPRLKIDLRQTYFTSSGASWFRVLVNDTTQISDINGTSDFTPATPGGKWDTLYFDLSDYSGSNFTVTMQSACRSPGTSWSDYGDNVFIDNLVIGNAPVVNIGTDQMVCVGETVVLDAGSGSGYTYDWRKLSSGDQLAVTQTLDVTTDGDYIAMVTNSSGLFDSDTVKVTFSKPVANAGADQSVCYGDTATLESVTEWTGYEWQIGETTRSIEYIVFKDSTFTLTVTDSIGCTDVDEVIVIMNNLPVINLGDDAYKCPEEIHTLNAGGGFSYLWSDQSTSQLLQVSTEDTYWVEITDGNGCKNRDTIDIFDYVSPIVNLGPDTSVCPGGSVIFDAGDGFASYSWSTYETTRTIEVTQPNNYHVTVTDGNGCTAVDTIGFSIYTAPSVDLGQGYSICIGASTTLDAGTEFVSYLWSDSSTAQTLVVDTSGLYSVTVTDVNGCNGSDQVPVSFYPDYDIELGENRETCEGDSLLIDPPYDYQVYNWSDGSSQSYLYISEEGSYSLTATDFNGCSWISDTITLTVNSLPVLDLGDDFSACEGETVILDPGDSFAAYNWNDGLRDTQTFQVYGTGTNSLTVTDENGCQVTDEIMVTFIVPAIVNLGDDIYKCYGEVVTLDAGVGFTSYSWSEGSDTQTINVDEPGTYTVEVVDVNGCSNSDQVVVTEYSNPDVNLGEDRGFCSGGSIDIGPSSGFFSYLWSDGSTSQFINVNSAGSYWILVSDANGCIDSDTINIVEYVVPSVNLGTDTAFCQTDEGYLLDAGNAGADYLWSNNTINQTLTVYASGTIWVKVTNTEGCEGRDTVIVTVHPLPPVSIILDNSGLHTNYTGGVEYAWYLDGEVIPGATTTEYTPDESGKYKVYSKDENGCSAYSSEMDVTVESPTTGFDDLRMENLVEIYPNPTTGKFIMKFPDDLTSSEIQIFNLTGNLVFREQLDKLPYKYEKPVDLKHLSKGVYLIRVELGEQWELMKLIIE